MISMVTRGVNYIIRHFSILLTTGHLPDIQRRNKKPILFHKTGYDYSLILVSQLVGGLSPVNHKGLHQGCYSFNQANSWTSSSAVCMCSLCSALSRTDRQRIKQQHVSSKSRFICTSPKKFTVVFENNTATCLLYT